PRWSGDYGARFAAATEPTDSEFYIILGEGDGECTRWLLSGDLVRKIRRELNNANHRGIFGTVHHGRMGDAITRHLTRGTSEERAACFYGAVHAPLGPRWNGAPSPSAPLGLGVS